MNQTIQELIRLKKITLIAALIMILLNIGLFSFTTFYLEPKIDVSQASWTNLRQRVAEAGKSNVATVYSRGVDDLKKLLTRIPVKRQFPRVLGDILDAAASNNVVTGNISYKPQPIKNHDLLVYGIAMSVGGSYAAVKSFLGDLQKNSEMVVIDNISLSRSDFYEENVVMDIHLRIFLQSKEGA